MIQNSHPEWIDLTHPLTHNMPVWEGDPEVSLKVIATCENEGYRNSIIHTGMHAGTHIDGPAHIIKNGPLLSSFPPSTFVGEGVLLRIKDHSLKQIQTTLTFTLKNKIVILDFEHAKNWGHSQYYDSYPEINPDLSQWLIKQNIKMLGMDLPSPDRFPYPLHHQLLKHGILIIENLTNLDELHSFRRLEIIALPLKIDADSSPARVLARYNE